MYSGFIYTKNGSYPQGKPKRIRLPNGFTKTHDAITHELMLELGYSVAPDYPRLNDGTDSANWPVYEWDSETSSWILK